MSVNEVEEKLSRKDFVSSVDVRWCPGCGDYAILNSLQKVFPDLGIPKEKFVVVSGIGCSSRFPYYMNTYGFHTIHGRAPTVATGIKISDPSLSVWVITGDGDGLSIGGNHLLHSLRRNLDINILLFNNKIYGLTKGQYSPTSELGKKTKTSPMGSVDHPINPLCFSLAAEATFVARTMDTNPKHMIEIFHKAAKHKGTSFVEIMQNCVIFNNQAWGNVSERDVREERLIMLEHEKPLIFGKDKDKAVALRGLKPEVVSMNEPGFEEKNVLVHNEHDPDPTYAYLLTQMHYPDLPTPIGVFRDVKERLTYDEMFADQTKQVWEKMGKGNLQETLQGQAYWEVTGQEGNASVISDQPEDPEVIREEQIIMKERTLEHGLLSNSPMLTVLKTRLSELVKTVGLSNPITCDMEDTIDMLLPNLSSSSENGVIVKRQNDVMGIVSIRDVVMRVVGKTQTPVEIKVSQVMSACEVLTGQNTVGDAINKMSVGDVRYVVICKEGMAVSLISSKSLLRYLYNNVH